MKRKTDFILLVLFLFHAGRAFSQMLDPEIDNPDEPFCYFSKPTDVIGIKDGREATLVTPEGYFYTGFGEVMFFTGYPIKPINKRVKELHKGYLPVIEYGFVEQDIEYEFQAFATTLDSNSEDPLINFVKTTITNRDSVRRAVYFSIAHRYQNEANTDWGVGDNRFGRPIIPERLGAFEQLGDTFSTSAVFEFREDAFYKDNKLLYLYPLDNLSQRIYTEKTGYNELPYEGATTLYVLPTTPVGIVQYKLMLESGESDSLIFKFPYLSLDLPDNILERIRNADYDSYLTAAIKSWNDIINSGISIEVPECKVNNTFKASLIYDLIAREKHGNNYVQKVNHFQYDAFWLRDASFIVRMYDVSGYHKYAEQVLNFFPSWQRSDGNFVSQGGQYDGWGQVMWAFGQHLKMTGDTSYIHGIYPALKRAFYWLKSARESDHLKIMPKTTPGDNENITGHVTGHNFWALGGLKNLVYIAETLGKIEDAKLYQEEYDDYSLVFMELLDHMTGSTSGYITPGIERLEGQDWGNMMSLYPNFSLEKNDPRVRATIEATSEKYQEGIMTYGDGRYLHHYLTMKNTQTELILGLQQRVIEEFYSILLHTGSTHTGFEFSVLPWSIRDFGMNLTPHGWFGAEFRTLLRNMMLREEGNDLHLFSALSPEWLKPGDSIIVKNAPTNFGQIDYRMHIREDSAVIKIENMFTRNPDNIIIHVPWFITLEEVVIDGIKYTGNNKQIITSPSAGLIRLKWKRNTNESIENYSYTNRVKNYLNEYRIRYHNFLTN